MVACHEFSVCCRLGQEHFTLRVCCHWFPWSHGLRLKKAFIMLIVLWWHQFLSDSLPIGRLSQVSRRLGQELFTLLSYIFGKYHIDQQKVSNFMDFVFQALRKVGKDHTILMLCVTVFLSYLPEAGQYSCIFVYLKLVSKYVVSIAKVCHYPASWSCKLRHVAFDLCCGMQHWFNFTYPA
jgi:hypothetical protein